MPNFKLLRKLFPSSPDKYLKNSADSQAAVARFAHLNKLVDELTDYKFYEHDWDDGNEINIDSSKGIIEIFNINKSAPGIGFTNPIMMILSHPQLLTPPVNADQVYIQFSLYYSAVSGDNAVPYMIATGGGPVGRFFKIYDASGSAGSSDWEGLFYIYYEIKVIS